MTLTDATRDVVPDMLSCSGISNPMQWPPSSPPPRPKARMATAGGYENVQTPLLEAGLSSMFHHRLVRPAKFRCVSLSYPRSWGRAAKKHLRYTSRESPQGTQRRDNTHTPPHHPFIQHSPSRQSISPQIDENSQTCLFQFPALLTPACSSRATPGMLFPLHN